ncbi:MAG: twin-arginine translocase TatA/TatE family subunit [Bacteroidales bacterium]|nr:twin-arginine translocase TatA/TatE family subunit [Bacteroidales bacterium]
MLLFFNISGGEILLIVIVVYLVFGPKKIPELARMLGKGINELRRATDDIKREFNREVDNVKKDIHVEDPFKSKNEKTTASSKTDTSYKKPEESPGNNTTEGEAKTDSDLK